MADEVSESPLRTLVNYDPVVVLDIVRSASALDERVDSALGEVQALVHGYLRADGSPSSVPAGADNQLSQLIAFAHATLESWGPSRADSRPLLREELNASLQRYQRQASFLVSSFLKINARTGSNSSDLQKLLNRYNIITKVKIRRYLKDTENYIESKEQDSEQPKIHPRLKELDEFARMDPTKTNSELIAEKFPELADLLDRQAEPQLDNELEGGLPTSAPRLYSERQASENPISFIRTHYGPWIGKGLERAHLKALDLQLYNALANWERRHPEDKLSELPRKRDVVGDWVERVQRGEVKLEGREEKGRFAAALRRRSGTDTPDVT